MKQTLMMMGYLKSISHWETLVEKVEEALNKAFDDDLRSSKYLLDEEDKKVEESQEILNNLSRWRNTWWMPCYLMIMTS